MKQFKLQGRGENVPYLINAINLATQIFNFDGSNHIIIERLVYALRIEYNKFCNFVDKDRQWSFQNATSGI